MSNLVEEAGPQKKPKHRIINTQHRDKASQEEEITKFFGVNRFNTLAQDMEVKDDSVVKETPFHSQLAQRGKKEALLEGVLAQVFGGRGRSRRRISRKSNPIS
eukprot:Gb_24835 [translate_table: standard]